jgi:hypothetical protein
MKMIKILQTVSFFSVLIIVVSCSTSRQYPRSYPPDYPVYHDSYPQSLPPGQAKKVYGSRSARPYAPGQRKKYDTYRRYPLIIIRTPDIIIGRYNDGRYYYRNPDGYMYWKGYDDRFYLDERYLNDNGYDDDEYNDWKYKGRNHHNNNSKRKNKWKG